jgi:anti-sigma B factor antagonist
MPTPQPVILMPEPFEIEVRPDRTSVVVAVTGEVDLATVDELSSTFEQLRGLGWRDFVVDLRDVSFLDSTGVHLLLDAHARALAGGGSLTVVHTPPAVHRVLELTGVARRLEEPRARVR